MNYTLKIIENGQPIRVQTHSLRRFTKHLRTINWQNRPSVYLRVSYGKKEDCFGKISDFWNDGMYCNEKDFLLAFEAFKEAGYHDDN